MRAEHLAGAEYEEVCGFASPGREGGTRMGRAERMLAVESTIRE